MNIVSFILILYASIHSHICSAKVDKTISEQMSIYQYGEKISISLKELKDFTPEEYFGSITSLKARLKNYYTYKKRVCQGEFSATKIVIKGDLQRSKRSRKKVRLSKKERNICYLEMENMQISYITNSYFARKRYIEYLHLKNLEELEKLKNYSLKNLRSTFN